MSSSELYDVETRTFEDKLLLVLDKYVFLDFFFRGVPVRTFVPVDVFCLL